MARASSATSYPGGGPASACANQMAARSRSLPRRRRQVVAAADVSDLGSSSYRMRGDRLVRRDDRPRADRGSAFEGSLDDKVAANHALFQSRPGEPLSEFAGVGAGRFGDAQKEGQRGPRRRGVQLSDLRLRHQARRFDRPREQTRARPSGRRRRFRSCKACASSPPGMRRSSCRPRPRRRRLAGPVTGAV